MFMLHKYENNYSEEKKLDTNHTLTLTLSIRESNSVHFTSRRCYDATIFNFAYMNSPKI